MKKIDVDKIYRQYQIPPNLVEHMEWVAEVAKSVLDHWRGPAVDGELTILAARLHDLGNIVKFRRPFEGKIAEKLLSNLGHWYKVQDQFIAKYGTDANQVTHHIIAELGLSDSVGRVLKEMDSFSEASGKQKNKTNKQVSFEARIAEYGDCCVSPDGIVGFEARLRDLCDRYNHHADEPWAQVLRKNAQIIESLSRA